MHQAIPLRFGLTAAAPYPILTVLPAVAPMPSGFTTLTPPPLTPVRITRLRPVSNSKPSTPTLANGRSYSGAFLVGGAFVSALGA